MFSLLLSGRQLDVNSLMSYALTLNFIVFLVFLNFYCEIQLKFGAKSPSLLPFSTV